MPQLIASRSTFGRLARSRRGSALVGVVSLATIMAITSVGLLQVAGTAVNNEIASLEETRAFWAAESGLQLIAASIFLGPQPGEFSLLHGPYAIDGLTVRDSVIKNLNPDTTSVLVRVFSHDTYHTDSTFIKGLRAKIVQIGGVGPVRFVEWREENQFY
jgi:hypothetical protein